MMSRAKIEMVKHSILKQTSDHRIAFVTSGPACIEAPRRKQRGIFDPKGETSICMVRFANDVGGGFAIHCNLHIRASNPRPKGAGNATRVRVQKSAGTDRISSEENDHNTHAG